MINVRTDSASKSAGPLLRKLLRIKTRKQSGFRWFFWYWEPKNDELLIDCGYSGIREDHPEFDSMRMKMAGGSKVVVIPRTSLRTRCRKSRAVAPQSPPFAGR